MFDILSVSLQCQEGNSSMVGHPVESDLNMTARLIGEILENSRQKQAMLAQSGVYPKLKLGLLSAKLWRSRDSIPGPRRCERRTLPIELHPRLGKNWSSSIRKS